MSNLYQANGRGQRAWTMGAVPIMMGDIPVWHHGARACHAHLPGGGLVVAMELIYHWCPKADWQVSAVEYTPPAFDFDSFVHCSYQHQVERTATAIDRGRHDLVLLCINAKDLPVEAEDCYDIGESYPHIYGPVPAESVAAVAPFHPSADGSFTFPSRVPIC